MASHPYFERLADVLQPLQMAKDVVEEVVLEEFAEKLQIMRED